MGQLGRVMRRWMSWLEWEMNQEKTKKVVVLEKGKIKIRRTIF